MTDPAHTDTGTFHAASAADTAGATLRSAREKAGLRLDEIAVRTRIPLNVLEAIEHDDTAKLGQPVYVRGYLRKYAKAMNLQESQVLTAFDARAMAPPPETTRPAEEQVEEPASGSRAILWVLAVIILAAVAGAAVMYIRGWGPVAIHHKAAPARTGAAPRISPPPAPVNPPAAESPTAPPQGDAAPAPATDAQPQGQ